MMTELQRQKTRARARFHYAVKTGKVVRPQSCERCDVACKPHGHHPDYSEPYAVTWLCSACHMRLHAYNHDFVMSPSTKEKLYEAVQVRWAKHRASKLHAVIQQAAEGQGKQ